MASVEYVDVAIVGGGPAGSAAAHASASRGASTLVLEKGVPRADRADLGPDSTDAGGVLDYWVDIMGIHPDELPDGVVQQKLDSATFIGPNTTCIVSNTRIDSSYDHFGYTFHRTRFDDWMRERAEAAGAEYWVGARVRNVQTDPDTRPTDNRPRHVLTVDSETTVGADFLILADGPQRSITNSVLDSYLPENVRASDRLASPRVNHIAYQEYRRVPEAVFETLRNTITFWWGVLPGRTAYPWIFPNRDRICRVGLTMPIGLDIASVENRDQYELLRPEDDHIPTGGTYIRRLLEWQYGDEYDIERDFPLVKTAGKSDGTETYPISSTRPIDSPVSAGIAVTGCAMGATSAFHEGGDHVAVRTGRIAGELAATGDLSTYNDRWKEAIGDEVLRNVTAADLVESYGPLDWDHILGAVDALLASEAGGNIRAQTVTASWDVTKLVFKYWRRKWRIQRRGYVQIHESEYTV